ncbi:MAG TPA: UDP-N-acetylmuramoyl-tripeptide--D-alanyl-D-alanine ligase [Haloplasmataceae bacterium]
MIFLYVINLLSLGVIMAVRYVDLLHILQLEKYQFKRLMGWFIDHLRDRRMLIPFLLSLVQFLLLAWFGHTLWGLLLHLMLNGFYLPFLIRRPPKKVPLVYTNRIKRLLLASVAVKGLFYVLTRLIADRLYDEWQLLLVWLAVIHFLQIDLLFFSFYIMWPIEKAIALSFIRRAKKKLQAISPQVIGITGSYGKTSTKAIIQQLLKQRYFVCATPASYNTPLGIARTINERLRKFDQIFICEMGATKLGDIHELAQFVRPRIGIITAIGPQHLDTFQNMQTIIRTKFELIEGLPEDGIAILNYDNRFIKGYKLKESLHVITYGITEEGVNYRATNIHYGHEGSRFEVVLPDRSVYAFRTKLLGLHNIYNILAGIALAHVMKVPIRHIQQQVERLEPVPHRLELKPYERYTIIDDSFNSNREGFQYALDVLNQFPGKKAIITPGLIELGDQHYAINYRLGTQMARICDLVVLIGKKQTKPIYDGLVEAGFSIGRIVVTNCFQNGFREVFNRLYEGFTLLIENDLPDQYTEE